MNKWLLIAAVLAYCLPVQASDTPEDAAVLEHARDIAVERGVYGEKLKGSILQPRYTIEIAKRGISGKPYLKLISQNGKTVMHGEVLANRVDAMETASNISNGTFEVVDKT